MVGRQEPLDRLIGLMDVVRDGRGRFAFVIGEPGIGKSRLLAELRRAVQSPAPGTGVPPASTWIEGRCVSYGRNLPYHLLIDLVRSIVGLSFGEPEAESRRVLDARVEELLSDVPHEAADTAPYLANLLGLPLRPDEQERTAIDPDVTQARYVAATLRLLRGLTRSGPIVLILEDIHWADPASLEVARQLLPLAAALPILVVAALRAETDAPGWGLIAQAQGAFGDRVVEIRLEPLNDADSRTLISNLLEIESLPEQIRATIMARAEGNPFFVEEVVRMLIERGVIVAEGDRWVATGEIATIEIPENLHGLLLARIDGLPESAKRSLRIAAVIGRQFPVRVLERVVADAAR
jgi:predicted ATPase